jgi:hypothetical protein
VVRDERRNMMELSQQTVSGILERLANDGVVTDLAKEYGEPGYELAEGSTPAVVLGSYWCRRCPDKDLHAVETHHPRLWAQLEAQGLSFEWYDEWVVDWENGGKAYRTTGDSYGWQPSLVVTDDGEMLTPDDDLETWVEWATEDPSARCIPSTIAGGADVEALGFTRHNGQFENGWHPGQTDDPRAIVSALRERYGDEVKIVFTLDSTGQFDVAFSAYYRVTATYVATINVPGYLPMDDDPPTFDSIRDAWLYLADERERGEDSAEDWRDDDTTREDLLDAAEAGVEGTVYGPTPGYDGDHDLGLAYSVSLTEGG